MYRFQSRSALRTAGIVLGALFVSQLARAGQPAREPAPPAVLETADAPRLAREVKAEKGHVVIVQFWAGWAASTPQQMPIIVELYKRHHAQGLSVISVATDPLAQRDSRVLPLIRSYGITFPTFMRTETGDAAAFLQAVDAQWKGELPRTYLLGRDGGVRRVFGLRFAAPQIEQMVTRLLAEPADATGRRRGRRGAPAPPTPTPAAGAGFLGG